MPFNLENRILVLGNSGSGKSWLAGFLAYSTGLDRLSLDDVCWEPGGFYKRRSEQDIEMELKTFSQKRNWVIEGVYGDFVSAMTDRLTHLFWLDLDPVFCAESVSKRGFDNIPWMNTEAKIEAYLNHIRSYQNSSGPMSRTFHEEIYKEFKKEKRIFTSRDEVNKFIAQLT